MAEWTDAIVGERMAVDREFNERLRESEFTNQEWGLIMTATELEIERPDDPERARLVANTEKLPQIMPELENVRSRMPAGGAPGAGDGGGGGSTSGDGLFGSIKNALGLGDGGDDRRLEAAERLTQEYADRLQSHLEKRGKWDRARAAYLD